MTETRSELARLERERARKIHCPLVASKSDEVKGILKALFPTIDEESTKKKPTLDDYTSITSYEDACEALDLNPILSENKRMVLCAKCPDHYDFRQYMPNHIIALMKLETISRALWGRNWVPKPDAEGSKVYYWPWFCLYTKKEVERMTIQQTGALLSADADDGADASFGCLLANYRSSDAFADVGFCLCQETEEKAAYFGGRNFVKLWAEYLQFNFEVGDFL